MTEWTARRMKQLPEQFFTGLAGKVNMRVALGEDVINLGQGNPDLPTPPHIVEALREAVLDPSTHRYGPFRGLDSLRHAVAEFYQKYYDVSLNPDTEVALLFGGKAGLAEIPQVFLNEGDPVLVPDPGYPDYESGIRLVGANLVRMPLLSENGYLPDLNLMQSVQPKVMYLNYPSNPTGAGASSEFFAQVVDKAAETGTLVVHDFAYAAIGFDGYRAKSFLQTPGAKDCGIELYTLSKTFNMAGWRIAFAVGNARAISALQLYHDHCYVSLFPAVQRAAEAALRGPMDAVTTLRETYERRRDAFYEVFEKEGIVASRPQGTFFGWMPIPKGQTSTQFADLLLERANVAVAAGIGFGLSGEGYVRIGLLTNEERLREAAWRIAKVYTATVL